MMVIPLSVFFGHISLALAADEMIYQWKLLKFSFIQYTINYVYVCMYLCRISTDYHCLLNIYSSTRSVSSAITSFHGKALLFII